LNLIREQHEGRLGITSALLAENVCPNIFRAGKYCCGKLFELVFLRIGRTRSSAAAGRIDTRRLFQQLTRVGTQQYSDYKNYYPAETAPDSHSTA